MPPLLRNPMAIGVKERKAASVLPAISLSSITFRRKSHSKHNINKPNHISRKFIFLLPSIRKSKSKLKSKPDPETNPSQPDPNPLQITKIIPKRIPSYEPHPHPPQTAERTETQIPAMREAFDVIQSDNSGRVLQSDFGFLMRSLGANPTQSEINSILAQEHLTSSFSFNKFKDIMSRHLRPEPEHCDTKLH